MERNKEGLDNLSRAVMTYTVPPKLGEGKGGKKKDTAAQVRALFFRAKLRDRTGAEDGGALRRRETLLAGESQN